ncbi:hypothetical protein Gotri_004079 [Gossypium trilobum]|uniref:Uncharacterized protein n=3 Tax=Gossypium TaxID=3633 RepID=A0A7J9F3M4_9ROSI|nr:hypothetical protein [Gossypium davidsonii]MBA0664332.1 hypothetical protein [Gossypium klotzschianum]MBA0779902.1 hypothetical protein [Gossypium trilobum]
MEEEYWHMILELDTLRMIEIKNSFNY